MKKIFLIIFLLFLFLALSPISAQAICEGSIVPCGRQGTPPCKLCHLFVLVNNIIEYILTCLIPIVATLLLSIGGFLIITAGENEERFKQGKGIITATVWGLVIIFLAWVILNTFFSLIGVAEWTGLKNWWEIKCE